MIANRGIHQVIGGLLHCGIQLNQCGNVAMHQSGLRQCPNEQSPNECPDWQSSIINGQASLHPPTLTLRRTRSVNSPSVADNSSS
jgi:hypothetical protein